MLNVLPLWQIGRAARVITIHDLAFLLFSDKHSPAQRKYLEISTRAAAQRADRIIAVSENTRQDILRLLNVSPNKVVTVAEAAGSEFTPLPPAEVASFRAQRGLPHRFFFYLGTLEPRKNIPELLRGYALMRQQEPAAPALIIAGPKGWLHDEIFTLLRELQLAPFVSFPGFVPRDELALWFNAALCFIYLSEYEGFGLPPLQAMACGIPPIINNASSLPEVVGDAGILVNAHDPQDVASALRKRPPISKTGGLFSMSHVLKTCAQAALTRELHAGRLASKAVISASCCNVVPMSSRPLTRRCLRKGSISK
jgi:glycosyltransferase involved in cell wall biosynthesis